MKLTIILQDADGSSEEFISNSDKSSNVNTIYYPAKKKTYAYSTFMRNVYNKVLFREVTEAVNIETLITEGK